MKRSDFEIEVCAGDIQSVIEADKGGADRVELCDNLLEGGTTPSIGRIIMSKEKADLDVFVLIRPRGGDFNYSNIEFEMMLQDVRSAVSAGADGFALGCLNADRSVNYDLNARLIEAANGLPITFHRAFDVTPDPFKAFETIKSLGISRILTSGQKNKAIDGISLIKELNNLSSEQLNIMPASGVDELNIKIIAKETNARMFHASLRVKHEENNKYESDVRFNACEHFPENDRKYTDSFRVKELIRKIGEI